MGFRFQRRLNYGSGLGLNLSKSGASPSIRTRFGTIGAKGFSLRTGIRGLYIRKSWGKGVEGAVIGIMVMIVLGIVSIAIFLFSIVLKLFLYAAWLLLAFFYNVTCWVTLTLYDYIKYITDRRSTKL